MKNNIITLISVDFLFNFYAFNSGWLCLLPKPEGFFGGGCENAKNRCGESVSTDADVCILIALLFQFPPFHCVF